MIQVDGLKLYRSISTVPLFLRPSSGLPPAGADEFLPLKASMKLIEGSVWICRRDWCWHRSKKKTICRRFEVNGGGHGARS